MRMRSLFCLFVFCGPGSATGYPTPEGGFVVLYDGPGPDR